MTRPTALTARADAIRSAMGRESLDMLVLYGNAWHADFLRYATDFGIQEGQGIAVVARDGSMSLLLDDPFEAERATVEAPSANAVWAPDLIEEARALLARSGNRQIAAAPFRLLPNGLASDQSLRVADGTAVLEKLLMAKMEPELEAVRRAAVLADRGYDVFRAAARPGRKDYELIAEVEAFLRSEGVAENFMIIGVGGTEVRGMAPPSGKVLKTGDLVTTELTPAVDGYYAQICRTLVVGEPTEAQRQAFSVYQEALEAGLKATRAGVTAADIARAENDVFRGYGLGEYVTSEYTRVRGHGVGLFPDTKPQILEDVHIPVEDGMTIIVHPNTYHPDVGYIVLGDVVVVRPSGHERLCATPRDLFSVSTT